MYAWALGCGKGIFMLHRYIKISQLTLHSLLGRFLKFPGWSQGSEIYFYSRPSELPRTNNSQSAPIQPQPPATQDEDSDSLEGFKIVHRKPKTASLFVCGIKIKNSADDTRNTVLNYLRKRKIKVTQLRIVKRGKFYMSVKLNVDPSHKDTVLSDNFWPGGVQCRQWHFDNGEANLL